MLQWVSSDREAVTWWERCQNPGAGPHLNIPILGHRAWNHTTSWILTALSWLCKETLEKPSSPDAISGSMTKKFRIFLCWCLQLDANSSLSELCLTWNLPYTDKYMLCYIRVICVPGLCFPKISSWTMFCYLSPEPFPEQLPNICELVEIKVSVGGKLFKTIGKQIFQAQKGTFKKILSPSWFGHAASIKEKYIYYYSKFATVVPQTLFLWLPPIILQHFLFL